MEIDGQAVSENYTLVTLSSGAQLAIEEDSKGDLYVRAREGRLVILPQVSNAVVIRVEGF